MQNKVYLTIKIKYEFEIDNNMVKVLYFKYELLFQHIEVSFQ